MALDKTDKIFFGFLGSITLAVATVTLAGRIPGNPIYENTRKEEARRAAAAQADAARSKIRIEASQPGDAIGGTFNRLVVPKEITGTPRDLTCVQWDLPIVHTSRGGISCDWESAKAPVPSAP